MAPRIGSTGWRVRRRVFALVARRASLCSRALLAFRGRPWGKPSTSLISAFKRGPTFAPWHLDAANRRLLSLEPRRAPRSSLGRGLSLRSIKRDRPALALTAKSTLGGGSVSSGSYSGGLHITLSSHRQKMGDKVRAPASSPPPPRHLLHHRLQHTHVHTSFANRGAGGLGRRWCAGDGAAGRERVARNASGGARGGSCRLSTRVGSSGVFAALRQPGSFCARGGSCARGRGALPVAARLRGGKPKHAHSPARRA